MYKVLITNAEYEHTLSIIRSMAKGGINIIAASRYRLAPSFYSRYVKKSYLYTPPLKNQEKFISDLIKIIKKEKPDVLLPVGTESTLIVSKYKDKLKNLIKIPFSNYSQMIKAHNKFQAMKLAEEVKVPHPRTFVIDSTKFLDKIINELGFPLMVKARLGTGLFARANSKQELIERIKEIGSEDSSEGIVEGKNPIIQEFIPGEIHDACVLLNYGKLRAALTQKRIRTFPIDGGPGILNETTDEPKLIDYANRLLSKINYHGVAQVEFIIDKRDNQSKLIEINPKIWGTTSLSIVAGINFPLLACKMAMEGDIEPIWKYRVGVRYKRTFPNLIPYLKQSKNKIQDALDLLNCFGKNTYCNFSIRDPLPDILQILRMLIEGFLPKRIFKK